MSSQLSDAPASSTKSPPSPRSKNQSNPSITEPSSFPKLHRSHHHHHHIHRHHAKDTHSAHSNPRSSASLMGAEMDGSKSEGVTPIHSQNPSRRASVLGTSPELEGMLLSWKAERKNVKEIEVREEKERGILRSSELRNALMDLNTLSNNTTRRLDNTYYSVLEKLSVLQGMITSLQELAKMTRSLNEEFKVEASKVVEEVEGSLAGFQEFEGQQKQIEGLGERVKAGRGRIRALTARVDVVRERVEGWEKAEEEWQDRARKRFRVLWVVMSIAAAIFIAFSIFQYTPVRTQEPGALKGMNVSDIMIASPELLEKIRNGTWSLKRNAADSLKKMRDGGTEQEGLDEDPRLRLLDEL